MRGYRAGRVAVIALATMDGMTTMKLRGALAAFGFLALAGSISAVSAADGPESVAVEASDSDAGSPRFTPSDDGFEASFAPFEDPADVHVSAGSVDMAAFEPEIEEAEDIGAGVASWYGREFAGRKTANGERFDPAGFTAAHRTLPFGSKVRVTHGGKSVVVRINDRGPFHGNRVIDLSHAAANELGLVRAGSGRVQLAVLAD